MRLSLANLFIVFCCSTLSVVAQETASIAQHQPYTAAAGSVVANQSPDSAVSKAGAVAHVLKTRCLDTGLLRLGSSCVFQVIEPMKLGDQVFAVGDLVYAHVETVQGVTGRVYMRTDRATTAQTQRTFPLSMVATEQPRQPGVGIPHMLDGWKLNWEQL